MTSVRAWATPLTIGTFVIMAVTGVLMFFHLDTGLNKLAHEWLGWAMIAGVVGHMAANWAAMKRYLLTGTLSRIIVFGCVVVLAASFVSFSGGEQRRGSPQMLAVQAILRAPLTDVALLAGRPVEQVIVDLQGVGIAVSDPDVSLDGVVGDNRELQMRAMRVLFRPSPR